MNIFTVRVITRDGRCNIRAIEALEYADARMLLKAEYERFNIPVRSIMVLESHTCKKDANNG
jgi:hypothetical protein